MKFTKNQLKVIRGFYDRNSNDFEFIINHHFIYLMERFGPYNECSTDCVDSVKAFCLFDDLVFNTSIEDPDFPEYVKNRNRFIYGKR